MFLFSYLFLFFFKIFCLSTVCSRVEVAGNIREEAEPAAANKVDADADAKAKKKTTKNYKKL